MTIALMRDDRHRLTFDLEAKPIRGQSASYRARLVNREGGLEQVKLMHALSRWREIGHVVVDCPLNPTYPSVYCFCIFSCCGRRVSDNLRLLLSMQRPLDVFISRLVGSHHRLYVV